MPSERVQRRIDTLLDEADEAIAAGDWSRVRTLCDSVLRLDPDNEDAQAYLEASGRDTGVNASHTDDSISGPSRVTEASGRSETLVGRGPVDTGADVPPLPAGAGSSSAPTPASFADGRYTVSKFLGEGGKKRVYLAHDTLLDREVAFALIKTEGFDETARSRITREAQAMGRLGTHPNIVTVFDLGVEGNEPYMVTELMAGGDVEGLLAAAPPGAGNGPPKGGYESAPTRAEEGGNHPEALEGRSPNSLSLDQTIEIAKAVCEGLQFAHERDIVHRDLKPGNVWLTSDPSTGSGQAQTAKIGDFGLAVMTDRSRLTREGMMVGTVSYMPPEQATGGEITPRADLYSLGAMLYEMVTGRPPFLGDDDIAIIGQHINTAPVAPTWHNGDCPRPLEALIMRLLSKDPSERPESAHDVYNALDAIDLTARGESVEQDATSLESLAGGVFVGRQAEMDQLKAALEDVLGGRGRLVTLVGEPGIGKTRTSEELATYAGLRGAQVLWGRCYETGGQPPYWPWVQAIRSYVREIEPDELRRQMGSSASVVAEIVTDVKDRLPELQPPPQLDDPDSARFRLFDSITSFLKTASQSQPLVLILDDLHWSDGPSLTFLEFVAREIGQSRLLVVGTYRDMELNRRHPLTVTLGDLARERLYERVLLRGLTQQDIARFIEIAAGVQAPQELSATVHRHTEGNPLFVTEVVRDLVQSGELAENVSSGSSTWSVRIPEGVREVIGRRLDRLSERANEVLTVAAVIGRDFRLGALRSLFDPASDDDAGVSSGPPTDGPPTAPTSDPVSESQLLDILDEALDARIIEELADEIGHYQFTHALMQETLTTELSATRTVRLHARIAEALERFYGDEADAHAEELTAHFSEAETVLGTDRLVHYSVIAGDRALANYAPADAEPYFARAWAALGSDTLDHTNAPVLWGLVRSRAPSIPSNEAQALWSDFERVFDYFAENGDAATAVAVVTYPMYFIGALRNATHLFDKGLAIVEPDSIEAGWILLRRTIADRAENRYTSMGGQADLERVISIGEKHDDRRFHIRMTAIRAMMSLDPMETIRLANELIEAPDSSEDRQAEIRGSVSGAIAGLFVGDNATAIRLAEQTVESATRTQESYWRTMGVGWLLVAHLRTGNWKEFDAVHAAQDGFLSDTALLNQIIRIGRQIRQMETTDLSATATAAIDDFDRVEREALTTGEFNTSGAIYYGEFLACLSHRIEMPEISEHSVRILNPVTGAIPTYAFQGGWAPEDWTRAVRAYALRDPDAIDERMFPEPGCGRFGLMIGHDHVAAELLRFSNEYDRASVYYESALASTREAGYGPELAWTCSDYAEMLLDHAASVPSSASGIADREKAIELQDEALAITRELGMRPLTERILARREILRA